MPQFNTALGRSLITAEKNSFSAKSSVQNKLFGNTSHHNSSEISNCVNGKYPVVD